MNGSQNITKNKLINNNNINNNNNNRFGRSSIEMNEGKNSVDNDDENEVYDGLFSFGSIGGSLSNKKFRPIIRV
jgi:hypothetical protein